jgi:hypothetical protein
MSNIVQLNSFITNNPKQLSTNSVENVCTLYHDLIESGFSSCAAYHEAMKLLLVSNPNFELSDLSKKTFEIINPVFDNYYENGIDNHSQN